MEDSASPKNIANARPAHTGSDAIVREPSIVVTVVSMMGLNLVDPASTRASLTPSSIWFIKRSSLVKVLISSFSLINLKVKEFNFY